MGALRQAWRRLLFLVRRDRMQAELDEEMRFHLECRAREASEHGANPDEARYEATRAFGNTLQLRERGVEPWAWGWLDRLSQDLRWATRTLRRSPGFTLAAVLSLALGIGVNTAIFTFVRAHLLRPLPYPHAERLVWVFQTSSSFMRGEATDATEGAVDAWSQQSRTIEAIATFETLRSVMTGNGEPEELAVGAVSPSLFELLGVRAWRGRLFSENENQPGRDALAVVSYAFAERRLGGAVGAVGRTVVLGGHPYVVVGVTPPAFAFAPLDEPREAWLSRKTTDAWIPSSTQRDARQAWGRFHLGVLARLKTGVTATAAQQELTRIAANASEGRAGAIVSGLQQELVKSVRVPLLLLAGAAGLVLLIVCANVAHLQLARGLSRVRELAIRAAIGAGRGRLVRQLLVESALLSVAGAALALVAVRLSLGFLVWLTARDLPQVRVSVDGWVLGFATLSAVASTLAFGLFPARQAAGLDPQSSLREGGRGPAAQTQRTTGLLVVAEVALTLVLVACAGLMLNTVWRLEHVSLGFRTDGLLTMKLRLPPSPRAADDSHHLNATLDTLRDRIRALPGVAAVEVTNTLPMGGSPSFAGFKVVGEPVPDGSSQTAQYRTITPGYFELLGIPLRKGRTFTDADRAGMPGVAIVNETMERRYLGGHALGKRIIQSEDDPVEVVGVVGDIRHETLRSDPQPEVYHPIAQRAPWGIWLAVRTQAGIETTAAAIRSTVSAIEPRAAVTEVKSMEQRRGESLGTSQVLVWLLGSFALLALVLALIGGYGVVNYRVSRRQQEFGVRLALGASSSTLMRSVLRETLQLAAFAVVLGLAGALACTRLLASYLFQVEPTDPWTLAAGAGVVVLTVLAAAYGPARRAAATDPLVALRQD